MVAVRLALKADDTQIFNYLVKLIDEDKDTSQSIYQYLLDSIVSLLIQYDLIELKDKAAEDI